jgi:hypothetical protein
MGVSRSWAWGGPSTAPFRAAGVPPARLDVPGMDALAGAGDSHGGGVTGAQAMEGGGACTWPATGKR